MNSFNDLILQRESCRNYLEKPVDTNLIMECIDAVRLAPSACNSQPWKYFIVNDLENAEKIRECVQMDGGNKFTDSCPAFVIVTEQKATLKPKIAERFDSQKWAKNDIGISAAYYCLKATELGLSTCIMGWVDENKLHETFNIPNDSAIRLVIATGYSADSNIREKRRKSLIEICEIIK